MTAPVELKKLEPWLTATRSDPSESVAMPRGKSRPLAKVVIRKSFEFTPGPWTVNGAAKLVVGQRNAVKIVRIMQAMCRQDTGAIDLAIMVFRPPLNDARGPAGSTNTGLCPGWLRRRGGGFLKAGWGEGA